MVRTVETSGAPLAHAVRLAPGDDLRPVLEALAQTHPLPAAGIASAVGSLAVAQLRMAGAAEIRRIEGPLEILTLAGTVGAGGAHLHAMVSDADGRCWGGHVCRGCLVHTTAELVLIELPGLRFGRELDPATGYPELSIARVGDATRTPPDV